MAIDQLPPCLRQPVEVDVTPLDLDIVVRRYGAEVEVSGASGPIGLLDVGQRERREFIGGRHGLAISALGRNLPQSPLECRTHFRRQGGDAATKCVVLRLLGIHCVKPGEPSSSARI